MDISDNELLKFWRKHNNNIKILYLFLLLIPFNTFAQKTPYQYPKVSVNITLDQDTLLSSDSVKITIKLTNNSDKVQKLLFHPGMTTLGPWSTSAEAIEVKTGKSALAIKNRALLSSRIYTEDELIDKYIYLSKGQSVSKKYNLSNLVVINFDGISLPKGLYELQIFYSGNSSNKVRFYII